MKLTINHHFTDSLPADSLQENTPRQVYQAAYSWVLPKKPSNPTLLHVSDSLCQVLKISKEECHSKKFVDLVSGTQLLPEMKPYSMCYGGHQFGNWAGQLGDGRAINLADITVDKQPWTMQLKGAGKTPYSRSGDGLAVLRSSIREYLCSEAMFHLGIPTTRALSLVTTGDKVLRDPLYDGNPSYEKGAIVCRVAPTFIRFGNFEIFAARNDIPNLKKLTDFTLKTHFKTLGKPSKEAYLHFFRTVSERSLKMVIDWQRVGFVHGVMNTDNMSILGLTIDYGPYGWLEGYDLNWTPNTTDGQMKRYAYGRQPEMVLWNLYQLANALYPLIEETSALEDILTNYRDQYEQQNGIMHCQKLGLNHYTNENLQLAADLNLILQATETDMTIFYRLLADFDEHSPHKGLDLIHKAFYQPSALNLPLKDRWNTWFKQYSQQLISINSKPTERKRQMNSINPKYVLRNYMAQLAIDAADQGDLSVLDELYTVLKKPYEEQPKYEKWFAKRPEWARHKVGCSMLSCSS
ncbi:YdiU family protein [Flavobacteriaceae bacterium F08102]|nr:YdiU family protein [Flavobacteriaceae bacterium F08102]